MLPRLYWAGGYTQFSEWAYNDAAPSRSHLCRKRLPPPQAAPAAAGPVAHTNTISSSFSRRMALPFPARQPVTSMPQSPAT